VITQADSNNSAPALTSTAGRADLRPQNIRDAVIRLAGNSQDGIQSAGAFLARLAGRSAQDVMTYMTIPSTISGGPSIFQVRIGTGEVLSSGDEADFLVAFYQHSYDEHIGFLKEGGVLLYDSDHVEPNLDDKRFVYVGVPITGLTVEALGGTAKDKGKNIFVLGLISKVFHLDVEKMKNLIREKFSGKDESIVNTALMAFQAGYGYPVGNVLNTLYKFEHVENTGGPAQVTMDGNQAIAYGLIAGGVRYGAAYPITPWSTIMEILRSELPKYGGLFVQCEDELGAVSMALGFSYSGNLAITGSSGPGISQDRGNRLGFDGGNSAHHRERPARRSIDRPADQRRAERSLPGNLRRPRRQPARRARTKNGRGLLLHFHRGGAHRAEIQHAGFHPQRLVAGHAHRGVRRAGFEIANA
jgi:2-oxoglutarate ferredoxin oxidoreductase subunit alpha